MNSVLVMRFSTSKLWKISGQGEPLPRFPIGGRPTLGSVECCLSKPEKWKAFGLERKIMGWDILTIIFSF